MPKRHYVTGARKFVGFRLPNELKGKIEKVAKELGWNVTDLVQTALDQYVHRELSKPKETKKKD